MKRVIPFSKYFLPTAIFSTLLVIAGIAGYIIMGGFNLGVDFQAGLLQEVQFVPGALSLTYSGRGNATIAIDRSKIDITLSGAGVDALTHSFPYGTYRTIGELCLAMETIEGLSALAPETGGVASQWLVQSARGDPQLGENPYVLHYLNPDSDPVSIEDVRTALLPLGSVSVQVLGRPSERRFMIRMEDQVLESGNESGGDQVRQDQAQRVIDSLEHNFGEGEVAIIRSDYVGSRYSKNLTDQAGLLMALTLLLILGYCSLRFKPQFAIGAVLAIVHDAFVMVAFIVWTRMEFNTISIAAILTILGYSVNDTIVILDRIKETRGIHPEEDFEAVLDRSLTETLSRTMITSLTTMLAVASLYIFTTGSMKDFALALLVGMVSGVYSTIFVASGFANFWDKQAKKREKKRLEGGVPAKAPIKA
ncbi:MAG: protein translocase subunit SecF [Spirochaetaceae bacterium]|jgi:preprotein translocase subunit SecF|nr:protein translocase subunit SecF [Spirochaetaceae bacterium]